MRGQAPEGKVDLDAINKIKEEGLKRSQLMEILSYLTDVQGARLTNSPNIRASSSGRNRSSPDGGFKTRTLKLGSSAEAGRWRTSQPE